VRRLDKLVLLFETGRLIGTSLPIKRTVTVAFPFGSNQGRPDRWVVFLVLLCESLGNCNVSSLESERIPTSRPLM
jgi:hypothetical protein